MDLRRVYLLLVVLCGWGTAAAVEPAGQVAVARVAQVLDVEPVWAAHAVRFCLLTHGEDQYVAYYDAQRRMSIAHRRLDQTAWRIHKLPQVTRWDSHNYVTLTIDEAGHLHVSGDMHGSPLRYFRTTHAGDVTSLVKVDQMVGDREDRAVTYPVFIRLPGGQIIFRYRYGSSGSGDDIYNIYDAATQRWRRLVDGPVVSGEGQMNAYCSTPLLGPDGWFHMVWVWRDTGDAATCHDLSYARSRDLLNWQTAAGKPIPLPITLATGDIIDPVPIRGGLINNNPQMGFDSHHRPLITWSRYDAAGNSQVYLGRPADGSGWLVKQLSQWNYRREFGGGGTLSGEGRIDLGSPRRLGKGRLGVDYAYPGGSGTFIVDEATLDPIGEAPPMPPPGHARLPVRSLPGAGAPMPALFVPQELLKVESPFPGMVRRYEVDSGAVEGDERHILTWETLPPDRDRPRPEPWPEPSMLRVVKLVDQ